MPSSPDSCGPGLVPVLAGRWATPEDLAQAIGYLVSPLSGQITAAGWDVGGRRGTSTVVRRARSDPTTDEEPAAGSRATGSVSVRGLR
ncbi:hypothetical protein ABT075_26110 [Streptomyces sp. NPDC002677]|uniref:hypothetical protein n=1 Tax=Streptomyces sp. NPDC002677 TaxID=3154774 RepID=UPI003318DD3B